jgi:hypothetical protein
VLDLKTKMMDDFYNFKWSDDQQEKIDNKSSNDQKEKTKSKWEIINFFEKYYLIDQKEIDVIVNRIGWPKTINKHGEKI